MQKRLIKLYRNVISSKIGRQFLNIYHPELGSIVQFIIYSTTQIKNGSIVLDAGAGSMNYKPFFMNYIYVATDFCKADKIYQDQNDLDFICDLKKIPDRDNTYDAIINIQVIEHIDEPSKMLNEFYRILKKDGKLFLTAPQGWGLHDEPFHYFNFTRYGLKKLFNDSGFKILFIKERGGYFSYLTLRLQEMPLLFLKSSKNPCYFLISFPLFMLSLIFFWGITPPLFYIFDKAFDKEKKYTLGYACYCIKE